MSMYKNVCEYIGVHICIYEYIYMYIGSLSVYMNIIRIAFLFVDLCWIRTLNPHACTLESRNGQLHRPEDRRVYTNVRNW